MGSGFSGKYGGTWSSPEGEELRRRVLEAIERAGGFLVGDSAVQLAEALVRIAAGESPGEVDFPKMSDVALDLAIDALSPFVPGGPAATRALALAAKSGKRASRAAKMTKTLVDDERGTLRARRSIRMGTTESAIVMKELNRYYHARLEGRGRCKFPIGNYEYELIPHDFAHYEIIKRREIE